jgi:hypothetical protein
VRVDRTPQSSARPRHQPNRQFQQRNRVSLVVVSGLLLIALIVGLILWATSGTGSRVATSTTAGAGVGVSTGASAGGTGDVTGPVGISKLTLYDPDGDGTEHDTNVSLADDGNPSTAWTTVCYADRFLGGKSGLGLVADLGAVHSGTITAQIASAPYQVQILSAPDGEIPATVADWTAVDKKTANTTGTVTVSVTNARYVAVLFNEIGQDGSCTRSRFRGRISEMSFQPS